MSFKKNELILGVKVITSKASDRGSILNGYSRMISVGGDENDDDGDDNNNSDDDNIDYKDNDDNDDHD